MYFEYPYTVDSRDTDPFGFCRPSALLAMFQEAATEAAMDLHVSREEMLERHNAFWMLARMWYRLDRPLRWNERVTVRTWHRGGKGASMYRDFDLFEGEKRVGEAVSTWVLADADTHKPLRLSHLSEFQGTAGEGLCKDKLLTKVCLPEGMTLAEERLLHYSDADINRHVNNCKYADFACDALHLERLCQGKFVRSFQLGYVSECRAGETVWVDTAARGDVLFARGEGEDGGERQLDIPVASPEEELADRISLEEVLGSLPQEDQKLIRLRFYAGRTQSETAKVLHTTQVQVSRRERKILQQMRAKLLEG